MKNVCQRCGKTRILVKEWVEQVDTASGTSELTFTQYSCPDSDCQDQLDEDLREKSRLAAERDRQSKARELARIESRSQAKKSSQRSK